MKENRNIKFRNGFFAGFVAICFNTLLLKISPLFSIKAEGGGLLKLILSAGRGSPGRYSFLTSCEFALLFHFLTGFVMVYMYVFFFESITGLKGWLKGSMFSLVPWLINGFLILPLLGSGPLGIKMLSATGIAYFFVANWLFGLWLGALYDQFKRRGNR